MMRRNLWLFPFASLLIHGSAACAETWPTLEDLVPRCVLIAHCRTEQVEDRVLYKVLEIWKGQYNPLAFTRQPPTGYIDTDMGVVGGERVPGREVILFYTRHNQPPGGIERHDIALPVRDGKVRYPEGKVELGEQQRQFTLEEFKQKVLLAEDSARVPKPRTAPASAPSRNISGGWRMFLPAGFEHQVTLSRVEEDKYRLQSGTNFDGIYEIRGNCLVMVEPGEPRLAGIKWKIRSAYMLTLAEQPSGTGANYMGAILFRPVHEPELESKAPTDGSQQQAPR